MWWPRRRHGVKSLTEAETSGAAASPHVGWFAGDLDPTIQQRQSIGVMHSRTAGREPKGMGYRPPTRDVGNCGALCKL